VGGHDAAAGVGGRRQAQPSLTWPTKPAADGPWIARRTRLATVVPPDVRTQVYERLVRAGCVAADEEADELLAAASDRATLAAWVKRREKGEPLAWIVGGVRFLGRTVHVQPGVYVPRAQSTELAVRAADLLPERGHAADLCTGSGAIAVYLSSVRPAAAVVGTDLDSRAAASARRNGVAVAVADMDQGLASRAFDVVCAVTPYVPTAAMHVLPADVTRYEPRIALDGGDDGLDNVRRLAVGAARLLRPGGWLLTEIGGDQDALVGPVLTSAGFGPPVFWRDGEGDLRGVVARLLRAT
jgi:release factor glutamine methyltransferase